MGTWKRALETVEAAKKDADEAAAKREQKTAEPKPEGQK
jgi:hypothetical protein